MIAFLTPYRVCFLSCFSSRSWFLFPVPFLPSVVPLPPNQSMPAKHESPFLQSAQPSFRGSDRGGVIEQPVFLLLLGEPREPGMERVVGWQERLLAMEDRRVRALH